MSQYTSDVNKYKPFPDPNYRSITNPILYSVSCGDEEYVHILLKYGANLMVKNDKEENALEYSFAGEHPSRKMNIFKLILYHQNNS